MKNKYSTPLLASGILAVIVLIFLLFLYQYKLPHHWEVNLYHDDGNPYGTKYLYEVMKQSRDSSHFVLISNSISEDLNIADSGSAYLFAGRNFYADSADKKALLDFVTKGNDLFISIHTPFARGYSFYDAMENFSILNYLCIDSFVDTGTYVSFVYETHVLPFWFYYVHNLKFEENIWYYFDNCEEDSGFFSTGNYCQSTLNEKYCNMIAFEEGKGTVYLFTNPLMLSNHYLAEPEGLDFANLVLKNFEGKKIYWDEASKYSKVSQPPIPNGSFLKYIFSQPGLKWAWYLLVCGVILFIVFRSRRMQQIIPLMPENKNNAANFVRSTAMLYLSSGNHSKIASEMMRQFLSYVKIKYGIKIKMNNTNDYLFDLANVSGVDSEVFKSIFKLNIQLEVSNESENYRLKELNNYLDYFYNNCK
ncbi:MAG: hypothetical protein K9H16_10300 [Bacteroidales bacterium]|nr:hypothetical protein [Bacteroidales bacterium]